jgi:hypothetical protein
LAHVGADQHDDLPGLHSGSSAGVILGVGCPLTRMT